MVGIVGSGMIAHYIAPHLSDWGLPVTAVYGTARSHDKTAELAASIGAFSSDDWHDALTDPAVSVLYLAIPNDLHFSVAQAALLAKKHVILEKPICASAHQTRKLARLAHEQHCMLIEAVSTPYLKSFAEVKRLLPQIGTIQHVTASYEQRSSRYDSFLVGKILPAFDPNRAGGALMDLGLYNIHYVLDMFGNPHTCAYQPNIACGIDTSGTATLSFDSFEATCIAAKDRDGASKVTIQGSLGTIVHDAAPNTEAPVTLTLESGATSTVDFTSSLQWEGEFTTFARWLHNADFIAAHVALRKSIAVSELMTELRINAGIRFPADEPAD